jgi:eukaryotic translation initiation factor 2C
MTPFCSYTSSIANNDFQVNVGTDLPSRPQTFNQYGRAVGVTLNTFNVNKAPNTVVHQYDVSYSSSCYVF